METDTLNRSSKRHRDKHTKHYCLRVRQQMDKQTERKAAKQVYFDVLKGLSEQERNGGCKMLMHL
jgi:hypothetical protein